MFKAFAIRTFVAGNLLLLFALICCIINFLGDLHNKYLFQSHDSIASPTSFATACISACNSLRRFW